MFGISEFSRLTRVSIKALRHYDRLGLLVPALVDPRTRYRHYAARQAPRLYHILALRELGFSLASIADIMANNASHATMRRLLERRRAEASAALRIEAQRLTQVDAALRELNEPQREPLPHPVLRALPAVRIAGRRARVRDLDAGAQTLFEAVEADAARAGIRVAGPPVLIYYDRDHREKNADIEAGVPVLPGSRSAGRLKIRTLAAVPKAACVVYTGSDEQWAPIGRGLLAWLQRRRLAPAGPIRETFLRFGAQGCEGLDLPREYLAERTEDHVTEMQLPVQPSAERDRARR